VSILFDTSILIDHLRGRPEATDLLLNAAIAGPPLVSVLTRVEIEGGMRSVERHGVRRLFDALAVLPVSDEIAKDAGALLRQYRRSHSGIDLVDYVIAATARSAGATLATLNVKHFPMFARLESPYEGRELDRPADWDS
jgi:predicted nucleic acid-binding protein